MSRAFQMKSSKDMTENFKTKVGKMAAYTPPSRPMDMPLGAELLQVI